MYVRSAKSRPLLLTSESNSCGWALYRCVMSVRTLPKSDHELSEIEGVSVSTECHVYLLRPILVDNTT